MLLDSINPLLHHIHCSNLARLQWQCLAIQRPGKARAASALEPHHQQTPYQPANFEMYCCSFLLYETTYIRHFCRQTRDGYSPKAVLMFPLAEESRIRGCRLRTMGTSFGNEMRRNVYIKMNFWNSLSRRAVEVQPWSSFKLDIDRFLVAKEWAAKWHWGSYDLGEWKSRLEGLDGLLLLLFLILFHRGVMSIKWALELNAGVQIYKKHSIPNHPSGMQGMSSPLPNGPNSLPSSWAVDWNWIQSIQFKQLLSYYTAHIGFN